MSKIIACNNEISDIKYKGYTISKAYACGGSLVYRNYGKLYATDSSGGVMLSVPCGSGTTLDDYTLSSNETTCADTSYCHRYTVNAIIGNCVRYIGSNAFHGFYNLENVTLGKNVFRIDETAFCGCLKLTNINLENISTIAAGAFRDGGANNLKVVTLPKTRIIGVNAFCCNTGLTNVSMTNVETIYSGAFSDCTSLTTVTIGDKVTSIGTQAFFNSVSLSSVTIEASTPPTIGTDVFTGTADSLIIYVPAASVQAYQTARGWSTYADKIQAVQ